MVMVSMVMVFFDIILRSELGISFFTERHLITNFTTKPTILTSYCAILTGAIVYNSYPAYLCIIIR